MELQKLLRFTALSIVCLLLVSNAATAQLRTADGKNVFRISNVTYGSLSSFHGPSHCETKGGVVAEPGATPSPSDVTPSPSDLSPDLSSDLAGDVATSSFGAPSGGYSASPAMVGDLFGGGISTFFSDLDEIPEADTLVPTAGGDRPMKIAENTSPIPTDRIFFNYHYFANPLQTANGREIGLDRYVLGIEKTCLSGNASLEVRIPFASGLNSVQRRDTIDPDANLGTEFGNINVTFKGLLLTGGSWAMAAGLSGTIPTAQDGQLFRSDNPNSLIYTVRNESVHLLPFVGFLFEPGPNSWVLLFGQLDFDTNGNTIEAPGIPSGVLQDQNLLYLDASYGHWLYRSPNQTGLLTGIAAILECHYTSTMQDTDVMVLNGGRTLENSLNRMDIFNATGAVRVHLGTNSILTLGGIAPLRKDDSIFDAEFACQYVRLY